MSRLDLIIPDISALWSPPRNCDGQKSRRHQPATSHGDGASDYLIPTEV